MLSTLSQRLQMTPQATLFRQSFLYSLSHQVFQSLLRTAGVTCSSEDIKLTIKEQTDTLTITCKMSDPTCRTWLKLEHDHIQEALQTALEHHHIQVSSVTIKISA